MSYLHDKNGFGFWTENQTKVIVDSTGGKRPIMCDWIDKCCTGQYHLYSNCIFFQKEEDAIIFKLRFG